MPNNSSVSILIVGAGPAGLSAAIRARYNHPAADICVIDKASGPGQHNLSGAMLEGAALSRLLDPIDPLWRDDPKARAALPAKVEIDDILFLLGRRHTLPISRLFRMARRLKMSIGQMVHDGDDICSSSLLTEYLCEVALRLDIDVLHGFAASELTWDESSKRVTAVKLVDQGISREGTSLPNYQPGETLTPDLLILAEGADGLLTEQFIEQAGLSRAANQLYSLGIKELIQVSREQFDAFTSGRAIHTIGWPLWRPVIGPAMFGGGFVYPAGDQILAVGLIVGLDYPFPDFNPQDALTLFKAHPAIHQYVAGGTLIEAGARMIPEGGLYALPRDPQTGTLGRGNTVITGDSAGLVTMLKIKGMHNAILSGIAAGDAIIAALNEPTGFAARYTEKLDAAGVLKEMKTARAFRQVIAKLGPLIGKPLSALGGLLPKFDIAPDYQHTRTTPFPLKPEHPYDKNTFTALTRTAHREDEPSHLRIKDLKVCLNECLPKYGAPCVTFCPAGVYESIQGQPKPANPSNCVHCKTCQRKCPFDNIRWTVPEGSEGPRYKQL